jgi:hypothetical protein
LYDDDDDDDDDDDGDDDLYVYIYQKPSERPKLKSACFVEAAHLKR